MAFSFMSALGGAAERGSEIMQEERDNIQKITDQSLRFWTETGIGKYNDRKLKQKDLSMKFKTLSNDHQFTADQIDVIARQGKVDEVLDYVGVQRQRGLTVSPSDIVRFSGDYKDTGRTVDEVLMGVMGKVNSGMSVSDAIQDTTGKTTGFLGQDLGKIAQAQANAFGSAFGMDVGQLRALATDDITVSDSPVSGQLFLKDDVAEAQARAAIQGGGLTAGQETKLGKYAQTKLGVTAKFDPLTGQLLGYAGEEKNKARAQRLEIEAAEKFDELMKSGDYTETQARLATMDFIDAQAANFLKLPVDPDSKDKGVVDESGGVISSVTLPDYSGVTGLELPSRITSELRGMPDGSDKDAMIRHAEKALTEVYRREQGLSEPKARLKAQDELNKIIGSL